MPKNVNWKLGREFAQASRVNVISRNAEPVAMRPDYSALALLMKWVNSLSELRRHPTRDEAQKFAAQPKSIRKFIFAKEISCAMALDLVSLLEKMYYWVFTPYFGQ